MNDPIVLQFIAENSDINNFIYGVCVGFGVLAPLYVWRWVKRRMNEAIE